MSFLKNKNVTVTGGNGFLGSYILETLKNKGCNNIFIANKPEFDLTSLLDVRKMYDEQNPDIVIHLAASVGGIGANQKNPGRFFYENAIMGIQLMHEGYLHQIQKFVALGTICAYPKYTPIPFREEELWSGYPEETNAPYGLAKKMMLVQSQAYREQYDFNSIFLLPVNLYGPRDNFNPESSHVIPALIKKCVDALEVRKSEIVIWGSGKPSREFLYVKDAAEGILLATEKYNNSDPINIGAGFEVSIKDLVDMIVKLTGFEGRVVWDSSKPDGQPRRMLDISKAEKEFGFKAKTSFEIGLKETVNWYKKRND